MSSSIEAWIFVKMFLETWVKWLILLQFECKSDNLIASTIKIFNLNILIDMGLSMNTSNKIFFAVGLILELWFIIIYAVDYYYKWFPFNGVAADELKYGLFNFNAFLLVLFLLLLFFLGILFLTQALRSSTPMLLDLPTHLLFSHSWLLSSPSNTTSSSEASGLESDLEMIIINIHSEVDHIIWSDFIPMIGGFVALSPLNMVWLKLSSVL